ncbi:glyoxalase superfamily protein [Thalassovita aquimarina]|uniref:glyoxalase superfamily protein n=1 Tax=Thalassovita aquimarina TaxID=2785917 RepID=UPI00356438FA
MTRRLPTITEAKKQARRLRDDLSAQGSDVSHAQALEILSHQYGFRDWNAFHAAIGNRPPDGWTPGGRVEGRYLGRPFAATVLASQMLRPGWFRIVLELDEPVDVVRFDSFTNMRRRIRAVVGPEGHSREKTSDDVPHVELKM